MVIYHAFGLYECPLMPNKKPLTFRKSRQKEKVAYTFFGGTNDNQKRTYTSEFKQEAVRLWETSGKSVMAIERELGITHGLLNKWKRKLKDEGEAAFPGRRNLTAEQEKIRRLERKLAIAEQERGHRARGLA